MSFFENLLTTLLFTGVIWVILFFALTIGINKLVKTSAGIFNKFWGADVYAFSVAERRRKVTKTAMIIDTVICVFIALMGIFM